MSLGGRGQQSFLIPKVFPRVHLTLPWIKGLLVPSVVGSQAHRKHRDGSKAN